MALAALLLAGAGCAALSGPKDPPAAAPAAATPPAQITSRIPPAWITWPESDLAVAKNPHDYQGKQVCQRCHQEPPGGPIGGAAVLLCLGCHPQHNSNHPVGVVHRKPAKDLPYVEAGRIACHTCHDPHDLKRNAKGLRLPFNQLCLRCHKKH